MIQYHGHLGDLPEKFSHLPVISPRTPPRRGNSGLRSEHFKNYPKNTGYYSWLFQLMYEPERTHNIHIGRFENLREEALRLFEETGTPITNSITAYLEEGKVLNSSPRPDTYIGGYPPELEHLVADRDRYLIDEFAYEFSEPREYPKTDFFNHLGSADRSQVRAVCSKTGSVP